MMNRIQEIKENLRQKSQDMESGKSEKKKLFKKTMLTSIEKGVKIRSKIQRLHLLSYQKGLARKFPQAMLHITNKTREKIRYKIMVITIAVVPIIKALLITTIIIVLIIITTTIKIALIIIIITTTIIVLIIITTKILFKMNFLI